MFCVNCGTKLNDNARFCTACGTKVPVLEPAPAPEMKVDIQPAVQQTPVAVVETVAPAVVIPAPVEAEPVVVVEEAVPVAEEAAPAAEEAAPAAEEAAPVAEEAMPVAEESAPVAEESVVLAEEVVFVEEAPAPEAEEVVIVAEEPAPVVEESVPVAAAAPVAVAPAVAAAPVMTAPVAPAPAPAAPVADLRKPMVAPVRKKKPHVVVRILMQLLSLVLCLVLVGSLAATVVLADLNTLVSENGIKQLIHSVLIPGKSAPQRIHPAAGAAGVQLPGNVDLDDIPKDLLSGGSAEENIENLIEWVYEKIEESSTKPLEFTKEQVKEFVEESTLTDFVAEKLAGFTDDFINGTENTVISTEEIMDLLEENKDLIEDTFDVKLTTEMKKTMKKNIAKVVDDNDINAVIREQVFETVEETIDKSVESLNMDWEDIQKMLQIISSDATLYVSIGVCAVLVLLLCLLNFYNVPAGLTWAAVPTIVVGLILSLPLALLKISPELFSFLPDAVTSVIMSFLNVMLPIHMTVLIAGAGLLVISIFWRIIRAAVYRKRRRAAMA